MIRTDLLFITTSVSPGGHSSFLVNIDKFDEKMFGELIKGCWVQLQRYIFPKQEKIIEV